ncbi:multidrug efflux SMR transporter [Rhodococcus spelaei]|uniref:Multidrug resistance protein Mmr n=1 Tax=Rhodococcus spelaei TaxID=2546320 RepID=A0A541BM51_9NOCA|nr:multidrug efflux SMR transporter [Rhodococcus spelaei]TQF73402.1 multidrug efflux SMR transporter [Rhodococcus spelaei]
MSETRRAWAFLAVAITSEILATVFLGRTEQFTRPLLTAAVLCGYVVSFTCMAQALRALPVSLAYALWSGIGTASVAVIGIAFLGEGLSGWKVLGLVLIIAGVVVLNLRQSGPEVREAVSRPGARSPAPPSRN